MLAKVLCCCRPEVLGDFVLNLVFCASSLLGPRGMHREGQGNSEGAQGVRDPHGERAGSWLPNLNQNVL